MGSNRTDESFEAKRGLRIAAFNHAVARSKRRIQAGIGPAVLMGCLLLLGLTMFGRWPAHGGARLPMPTLPRPQTPFEASFTQAQRWYFRAQLIAKRQLESLEEWDPDGIRGGAHEIYRRRMVARTHEIGRAEVAAREAAGLAMTNGEAYRIARLLFRIQQDLAHRRAELAQANRMVVLQPRNPEAQMWLARALEDNGQASLSRAGDGRPAPTPPDSSERPKSLPHPSGDRDATPQPPR